VKDLKVTLRFDASALASYRVLAKAEGLDLSDFLRRAITCGVVAREAISAVGSLREISDEMRRERNAIASNEMQFQLAAVFAFVSEITRQRDPDAYARTMEMVKTQLSSKQSLSEGV
jgi:imidazolonepropionase-like amidohydrolase